MFFKSASSTAFLLSNKIGRRDDFQRNTSQPWNPNTFFLLWGNGPKVSWIIILEPFAYKTYIKLVNTISNKKNMQLATSLYFMYFLMLGTKISPAKTRLLDDIPFPHVGYVIVSLEGNLIEIVRSPTRWASTN